MNCASVRDVIAISDVTAEYGGRAGEDMPPCERTVTDEQRQSIMELSMRTHPGIWSVSFSPDGKADSRSWSKEICRLIGCSLEDRARLLFDTLSSHVHPDDRTEVHRVFELLHGAAPPSLDGLALACDTLIARTHPASRLSVTHVLSPLGLAVKAVLSVFSKLIGTSFEADQCVRADGSL